MRLLLTLSLLLTFSLAGGSAGIEFFHGTWAEALAKAEAEDKLIFIDAYASWCGPCKRMSANVFPEQKAGDFYNANFINIKYDMEKEESADFRAAHGSVRSYPTLLYVNAKNEVVHKSVGGKSVESLIMTGNEALAKLDDVESMRARWEAGDRDARFAFKYVRALVRRDENHLKVANDYLRNPTGALTDEYNLRLIAVATTDADSRIFDLFVKHRDRIVALEGEENYLNTARAATQTTIDKAVEFKAPPVLKLAVKKMSAIDAEEGKRMGLLGQYEMAMKGNEAKDFIKAAKKYLAKGAAGNEERLRQLYTSASSGKFADNADVIDLAVEAGSAAADKNTLTGWRDYYNIANYLQKQQQPDRAIEMANRSLQALPEDKKNANYRRAIEGLIQRIEAER